MITIRNPFQGVSTAFQSLQDQLTCWWVRINWYLYSGIIHARRLASAMQYEGIFTTIDTLQFHADVAKDCLACCHAAITAHSSKICSSVDNIDYHGCCRHWFCRSFLSIALIKYFMHSLTQLRIPLTDTPDQQEVITSSSKDLLNFVLPCQNNQMHFPASVMHENSSRSIFLFIAFHFHFQLEDFLEMDNSSSCFLSS